MSLVGQMLLLPHRSTDDRFTAISGPYLKLIDWPKGANSRPSAAQQIMGLLDHLVGASEQRGRYFEAESTRGLKIDDEFVLGRHLHRQISRFLAS
jgi:hypothetical protein